MGHWLAKLSQAGPKASLGVGQTDESHSVEAIQAKLFADHLQRTCLNSFEQNAHIFLTWAQILLIVIGVFLKQWGPLAHLSVKDPNR